MSYEQERAEIILALNKHFPPRDVDSLALKIFRYQATHNPLYHQFLTLLGIDAQTVRHGAEIPFLPIAFFKNHVIKTGLWHEETVFTSSGTTGIQASRHYVRTFKWYLQNAAQGFRYFYGSPADYCILALLPSYLEREGSSLIAMVKHFMEISAHPLNGFFLNNIEDLIRVLKKTAMEGTRVLLLGVSFALLDLADCCPLNLSHTIIMETGGMKGRRRELTRFELHAKLCEAFRTTHIHSEYGMTELFSQAYSQKDGRFYPSPTMRVFAVDMTDPFSPVQPGKTGTLNIMDLANFDTCSFIATEDIGRVFGDGSFEVLGRMDHSDIRGCNLMVGEE